MWRTGKDAVEKQANYVIFYNAAAIKSEACNPNWLICTCDLMQWSTIRWIK